MSLFSLVRNDAHTHTHTQNDARSPLSAAAAAVAAADAFHTHTQWTKRSLIMQFQESYAKLIKSLLCTRNNIKINKSDLILSTL